MGPGNGYNTGIFIEPTAVRLASKWVAFLARREEKRTGSGGENSARLGVRS